MSDRNMCRTVAVRTEENRVGGGVDGRIILKRVFNSLTPNVNYSGRTAPLTTKVAFYIFIQQI